MPTPIPEKKWEINPISFSLSDFAGATVFTAGFFRRGALRTFALVILLGFARAAGLLRETTFREGLFLRFMEVRALFFFAINITSDGESNLLFKDVVGT